MSDLTVTSDPSALLGTMFNPFQTMSTGAAKLYLPGFLQSRDPAATMRHAMIFHSLALLGTWGLGAAGASYMVDSFTARRRQASRATELKPGVMATYVPLLQKDVKGVISASNSLLPFDNAPVDPAIAAPDSKELHKLAFDTKVIPKDTFYYMSFVLPATAVALGIAAGTSFGSKIYGGEREVELDKTIVEQAKELDKLTMERLKWARGKRDMEKTAQWYNVFRYPDYIKAFLKGGKHVTEDVAAAMTAMAMGTAGIAALTTYAIARRRDPNVQRYKALEQGFKELVRSQARGVASTIRPLPPKLQEELDAMVAGKPLPEIPVSTTKTVSVDPSDQSLKLL